MAVNVNPSNNMWQGGAIHKLSPPTASSGGIAAANTSVSSPVGGVNPGAPFFTRPNTGSNIRVPYNRLCPLSSEQGGGLPAGPLTAEAEASWGMETDRDGMTTDLRARGTVKTETEDLHASRVAFILGKRSSFTSGPGGNPAHPFLDAYGINQALSTGVGSVHRMQKLCSMEYLERYFANRLAGMHVDLSAPLTPGNWKTGLLKQVATRIAGKSSYTFNGSIAAMPDLCRLLADTGTDAANSAPVLQGVFAHDNGPFLHGKPVKHTLMDSRKFAAGELDNWRRRFPYSCDRALGNEVAFAALLNNMEGIGLMDWTPDGIVLSKGTNDPSDKLNDEFIEARDGALFNIVVQGPTLSTSWSGKRELAVLPMDKVFIVIVADLWRLSDAEFNDTSGKWSSITGGTRWGADELKAYKALLTEVEITPTQPTSATLGAKPGHEILVNFRVRMSTSSEMVSYSNLKFHNGKPVQGSRMGLKHGEKMSEYIVGGWHLGNVMDSAASRRAMPGSGNITMRTAPNTMAHNINVNIEWWSGDRLWDAFMNKEGKLRERYQVSKGDLEKAENTPQAQ